MKILIDFGLKGSIEFVEEGDPRLLFHIKTQDNLILKDVAMLLLPIDQKVLASVQAVDSKGNPAPIQGDPAWTSSDPAQLTVTPDAADPAKAWILPVGPLGTSQVNVTADADLGDGVKPISGVLEVQTVAGEAVGFVISTEPPVPNA